MADRTAMVLFCTTIFPPRPIGWRGVWIVIGIGALVVWLFRFALPESPRYLATHGRGKEALDVLKRLAWELPDRRNSLRPVLRAIPRAIRSRSYSGCFLRA